MRLATSIVLFAVFSTFCQRARAEETPAPTPRAPSRPPAAAVDKLPPRPNSVEGYDETLERMRAALATAPATRAVRLATDVKVVEQWYREDVQRGSTGATVGVVAGTLMMVGGAVGVMTAMSASLRGSWSSGGSSGADQAFVASLVVGAVGLPVFIAGVVGSASRSMRVTEPSSPARAVSLSLGAGQVQLGGVF